MRGSNVSNSVLSSSIPRSSGTETEDDNDDKNEVDLNESNNVEGGMRRRSKRTNAKRASLALFRRTTTSLSLSSPMPKSLTKFQPRDGGKSPSLETAASAAGGAATATAAAAAEGKRTRKKKRNPKKRRSPPDRRNDQNSNADERGLTIDTKNEEEVEVVSSSKDRIVVGMAKMNHIANNDDQTESLADTTVKNTSQAPTDPTPPSGDTLGQATDENVDALSLIDPCSSLAIFHHSFVNECFPSKRPSLPSPTHTAHTVISLDTETVHESSSSSSIGMLGEDPTIEESIECVFAHQLAEGLPNFYSWEDEEDEDDYFYNDYRDGPLSSEDADSNNHQDDTHNTEKGHAKNHRGRKWPPHFGLRSIRKRRIAGSLHFISDAHDHDQTSAPNEENAATSSAPSQRSLLSNQSPSSSSSSRFRVQNDEYVVMTSSTRKLEPSSNGERPSSSTSATTCTGSTNCHLCMDGRRQAPGLPPSLWPQSPLMFRPTPGTGTRIRGVRFSGSTEYLWRPPDSRNANTSDPPSWWQVMSEGWKTRQYSASTSNLVGCSQCAMIPMNNGNEDDGRALLVDFESNLFVGTLILRIRHSKGTTPAPYNDDRGYFQGMNRRYQFAVRGMFKCGGIPMTECVSGLLLQRPTGKLPAKWMIRGALKVVSFFAPQLQAKFDGARPTFISPLGSTPQVFRLQDPNANPGITPQNQTEDDHEKDGELSYCADATLEVPQTEPTEWNQSLLSFLPNSKQQQQQQQHHLPSSSIARARIRKKAFDKVYVNGSVEPTFRTDVVYTFEFLQHLVDFSDLSVDLGSVLGKAKLKDMLAGQPLNMLAAHQRLGSHHDGTTTTTKKPNGRASVGDVILDPIWSFDIWHETLYDDALRFQQ